LFAAMLKDNGAATLIGTPTYGSGCGHMNGGVWVTLENSGGRVSLPDCARFRADGTNEVTGIVPDVLVPWRGLDSRYQRAKKTLQILEQTISTKERR
jgi:C-terminal processing protease CtpA/Prc